MPVGALNRTLFVVKGKGVAMEECDRKSWCERVTSFVREEDGPTATEYAIMLALLVLGAMATIQRIGESFQAIYLAIVEGVPEA